MNKCPKCDKPLTHVWQRGIGARSIDGDAGRYLALCCPLCHTIISLVPLPR